MHAVFFIDFELFYPDQIEKIAQFRRQIPSSVPVIWTITEERSVKPELKDGFYAGRDRLFVKPDINSSLDTAMDKDGVLLTDMLATSNIRKGFIAGSTYYGCVMGGALSLGDIGIASWIMKDLTDYHWLSDEEHAEAAEQWARYNLSVTHSHTALTALHRQYGPETPHM